MSTLKECRVIMLPTERADIAIHNERGLIHKKDLHPVLSYMQEQTYIKPQHLYIVSDDEIKEGDWYYLEKVGKIGSSTGVYKCGSETAGKLNTVAANCKKVIGTTDKSLTARTEYKGDDGTRLILPEPSKEFVQKYCEAGGIDKVMVKYDNARVCSYKGVNGIVNIPPQPHVSKDNTITIKPVKELWNRKEVEELCRRAWILGLNKPPYEEMFNAWKQSNL